MATKKAEAKPAEETKALSISDRFTNTVIASYTDVAKGVQITEKEKALVAGYFIKIDEQLRNSKQGYNWNQVQMKELSLQLANAARLGLDMQIDGQLSFIPFKVKDTGKINMVRVIGAKGYELIAKKYALDPPKASVVELVYSNDKFTIVKRDAAHECDDYTFEVTNPFDRGEVIGAFGYLAYDDKSKNKLLVMSKKQLLTYRPQYYDETFWKGENEKKMLLKTLAKQLFKNVTLDPAKVNAVRESINMVKSSELDYAQASAKETIDANMGKDDYIDADFEDVPVDESTGEVKDSDNISIEDAFGGI